jgi:hypothetical protein
MHLQGDGLRLMGERLKFLSLRMIAMVDDGNCQVDIEEALLVIGAQNELYKNKKGFRNLRKGTRNDLIRDCL